MNGQGPLFYCPIDRRGLGVLRAVMGMTKSETGPSEPDLLRL